MLNLQWMVEVGCLWSSRSGSQADEGSTMLKLHDLECVAFLRTPGDVYPNILSFA